MYLLPPEPAVLADSMVVVVEMEEQAPRIVAHAYPLDHDAIQADGGGGPATVTVLYSTLSLADLGLVEGEIPLARTGVPSRGFPAFEEAHSATVDRDGATPFQRLDAPPPRFGDLTLDNEKAARCGEMIFTPIDLPQVDDVSPVIHFALPLDERTVLVSTSSTGFLRVVDRTAERLQIPAGAPRHAGWRTSDGTVWLLGDDGAVATLDPDDPDLAIAVAGTSSIAPAGAHLFFDGAPDPPLELFAAGDGLWRFHDGAWSRIQEAPYSVFRQAMFIGRGAALFGWSRASVLRYDNGTRGVESLGDGLSGSVGAMVLGPDSPYVTLTAAGAAEFYRADRGGWERVLRVELPSANSILAMAARDDGFIFGGGSGHFGEVVRGAGLCPPIGAPPPRGLGVFWGISQIIRVAPDRFLIVAHGLQSLSPRSRIIASGLIWLDVR